MSLTSRNSGLWQLLYDAGLLQLFTSQPPTERPPPMQHLPYDPPPSAETISVDPWSEVQARLEHADAALAAGDLDVAGIHLRWAIRWHAKARP